MTIALAILAALEFVLILAIMYQHGKLVHAYEKLVSDSIELTESYFAFRQEFEAYRKKHDPRPVNINNVIPIKGDVQ